MSKGSKVVAIRFPADEYDAMLGQLADSEKFRRGEPWTLSEFVRSAIREKLKKMERSRKSRKPRKVPLGEETVSLTLPATGG